MQKYDMQQILSIQSTFALLRFIPEGIESKFKPLLNFGTLPFKREIILMINVLKSLAWKKKIIILGK